MRVALLALCLGGCSFVGVRGPSDRVSVLPDNENQLKCTESTVLPTIDSIGGILAGGVAVGGIILEKSSDDGKPENFTKYYAAPIAVVSILYFVAASYGNNRITWCSDAHERMVLARDVVKPIPPDDHPRPPKVEPKPEPVPEVTPAPEPVAETKPEPKKKPKPKRKHKPKVKAEPKPKTKPPLIELEPDPIR